ncbi:LysR substrate-binding domain-containing protein [Bosea vestrisii]|uniref:LysR substrate-binding domain-containing protein n=1 Tax=Bosea vestrisii TaxID=151416 RepID=UPI0024DF8E29|nr:LysR substrate-binding domain-containing protein [Bosea vestrisii]WID97883.1 LysR substrate-binding domain-containing protein [Bosea vestrisii]
MIETRLLRQFIAVAEELNFHRAAERLHMAQPPLSQAIRKLENALGLRLFERSNRSVTLTAAGAAFLVTARRVLAQLDDGIREAQRVAAGQAGRLSITFVGTAHDLLPLALRRFRAEFPGIELILREATTGEQLAAITAGEADIGLMRQPGIMVAQLASECLLREPILAALPDDHALAGHKTIALADLAGDDFIGTPRQLGIGFHDQIIGLCRLAGFSPRIAQEARQMQTVASLVASGLGVALIPASLALMPRAGVAFRPIAVEAPPEMAHVELIAAWDATRSAPARDNFLAVLRQAASDMQKVSK